MHFDKAAMGSWMCWTMRPLIERGLKMATEAQAQAIWQKAGFQPKVISTITERIAPANAATGGRDMVILRGGLVLYPLRLRFSRSRSSSGGSWEGYSGLCQAATRQASEDRDAMSYLTTVLVPRPCKPTGKKPTGNFFQVWGISHMQKTSTDHRGIMTTHTKGIKTCGQHKNASMMRPTRTWHTGGA